MSYLIFINELGPNYKGDNLYEFIFSEDITNVWGTDWDSKPANGYPSPPDIEHISKVGVLKNETISLSVIQKSDWFSMVDCMDGVISLGWESESDELNFETTRRLVFKFGETETSVKDKLYERDCVLEFEKNVVYEH